MVTVAGQNEVTEAVTIEQKEKIGPKEMIFVPAGTFMMGSEKFYPEERPRQRATVRHFWIDKFPVTNNEFKKFVDETSYVTVAERGLRTEEFPGIPGEFLAGASMVFKKPSAPGDATDHRKYWHHIKGACWKNPEGPESTIEGRENHPVVHVAFEDVQAYARWIGKELPTEAEWEYAAKGGLEHAEFSWGNTDTQLTKPMANTWQGIFPHENLNIDGFEGTSPVGAFPPNGYGLHDMVGNVWEWTCDDYGPHVSPPGFSLKKWYAGFDHTARSHNGYHDEKSPTQIPRKVIKGGSYLCAPNYSLRYRPAARQPQAIDITMSHIGFRCIRRINCTR